MLIRIKIIKKPNVNVLRAKLGLGTDPIGLKSNLKLLLYDRLFDEEKLT